MMVVCSLKPPWTIIIIIMSICGGGAEKGSVHSIFGHLIDQYIMMTTMTMVNQTKKKRMVNPKATKYPIE